jgi:AcrR family transcriptional regulator
LDKGVNVSQQGELNKRSWVITALMTLLEKKAYGKITMGDIAKKTGIARQTLYLLFKNKDDIVSRFLTESADIGLLSIERKSENKKPDVICITFNNEFVAKHYGALKKMLTDTHIHNLIIRLTREKIFGIMEYYKASLTPQEYAVCRYKLAYQIAGCLTVLTDWLNNSMPQSTDDLISILNALVQPMEKTGRHLPNIEIDSW